MITSWMVLIPDLLIVVPLLCVLLCAGLHLLGCTHERVVTTLASWGMGVLVVLSFVNLWLVWHETPVLIQLLEWYHLGHHSFRLFLENNLVNACYGTTFMVISWIVGYFSQTYLHKDEGFYEFFYLFYFFVSASQLAVYASTIDTLFVGWEIVGICSVLLIGFYKKRPTPVQNSLYAFGIYRVGEVFFLLSLGIAHIEYGDSAFSTFSDQTDSHHLILWFLMIAVGIKSAQWPFCGWLPKAMEGPTPSSAIFYGGISVHMGPMLLIKLSPYMVSMSWVILIWGGVTALYAAGVGRTRSDIKTQLAYATVAQIGLIFVEIGLGYHTLAMVHSVVHCFARTFQFLKAPSILFNHHALGLEKRTFFFEKFYPERIRQKIYYLARTEFLLDRMIAYVITRPFGALCHMLAQVEKALLKEEKDTDDPKEVLGERRASLQD